MKSTANEEKQLQSLGLSEKEAEVYLSALKLGTFSVAEIADKSGVKRPTCYLILNQLMKRGMVSLVPKFRKLVYSIEPPDILLKQVEDNFLVARSIIPKLHILYKAEKEKVTIKFYYGQKGIQNIYWDIIKSGAKENFYIGSIKELVEMAGEDFMENWVKERIKNGVKSFSIRLKESEIHQKTYQETKEALREIRYAPENMYIHDTILIYANKVAIISTKKANFGFVVESDDFVKTMKGLFDVLWQVSSDN